MEQNVNEIIINVKLERGFVTRALCLSCEKRRFAYWPGEEQQVWGESVALL
jgi:hypothetical protein